MSRSPARTDSRSTAGASTLRTIVATYDLGERWLALVEAGRVMALDVCPIEAARSVGSVVNARVARIAPALGGAFLDAGTGEQIFVALPGDDAGSSPRPGDELLVQVTRGPRGAKGPRARSLVSVPGWLLVLIIGGTGSRISTRIDDPGERARLQRKLAELEIPGCGLIARKAAFGASIGELADERARLLAVRESLIARSRVLETPGVVEPAGDPLLAFVRDHCFPGLDRIVVDESVPTAELRSAQETAPARLAAPVVTHSGPLAAAEAYRLDAALESALDTEIGLPAGGSIVIQPTEALVAIDVNSRRARGPREAAAPLTVNLEAAREIPRQLRLRNLSGLVVIDFIAMKSADDRRRVDRELADGVRGDPARVRRLPINELGVALLTRQRRGPSLFELEAARCAACGNGSVPPTELEARRLLRALRRLSRASPWARFRVCAGPRVLAMARGIAERHGPLSSLPEIGRISWSEGKPGVEREPER